MHAVDVWKVDIISMSFSLTGDVDDVKKAIEYAKQQKVLMFTAASNNRHNSILDIGFPASLGDAVVYVNSHHGEEGSSRFSPKPKDGHANLAVLGEGIEAAWKNRTLIRSEGTSCSTPIAAAIAALILDYLRQLKDRSMKEAWRKEANKEVNLMRNTAIVKWVMFNMMTRSPNVLGTKYNMVKPWYLFNNRSGRTEEQISKMLTDVVKGRVLWTSLH
jgi:hypothetical protein